MPARLSVDTFDGKSWAGVTPFTLWGVRPLFTPPVPWLSEFHEINVRTSVDLDGLPGVWFFSPDANSLLAVTGARAIFRLPYHHASISMASISMGEREGTTRYESSRDGLARRRVG